MYPPLTPTQRLIRFLWIALASLFATTMIIQVDYKNGEAPGVIIAVYMLMAVVINPQFWFFTLASLANFWFIWAWILGWYHLTGSSQRFMWRVVVVSGLVLNLFATFAVILLAHDSPSSISWLWLGSLLTMQLMVMVIAYDAWQRRRVKRK